jgi:hypothetical protein
MTERELIYYRRYRKLNLRRTTETETAHRRKRQQEYNLLKSKPCVDCGVQYSPWVMQFDHRNPATKSMGVGRMVCMAKQRLLAEIAKCDLVCANCHAERTHKQLLSKILMNGRKLVITNE